MREWGYCSCRHCIGGSEKNRENPSITLLPAGLRLGSVFSGALIADSLIGQEDSL
jgi:hypothetical protein